MDNKNLSIGDAGSLLIGAGLTKLDTLSVGMTLIGVGVGLKIIVAVLQKQGLEISNGGVG
ncbi:MAG: hypothetical protein WAV09_04280 [Minisyncoccia bacterium]